MNLAKRVINLAESSSEIEHISYQQAYGHHSKTWPDECRSWTASDKQSGSVKRDRWMR